MVVKHVQGPSSSQAQEREGKKEREREKEAAIETMGSTTGGEHT
jgi:hypothetical protein